MQLVLLVSYLVCFTYAVNYATYPQVPKTASINGFADPIYNKIPACAEECVKASTGNTPCPDWDTGCLCVMPQWSGEVAQCVAKSCTGSNVADFASLATSLCSSVGANTWMMPASVSSALSSAANDVKAASAEASTTSEGSRSVSTSSGSSSIAESTSNNSGSASSMPTSSGTSTSSSSSASSTSASSKNEGGLRMASFYTLLLSSFLSLFV